MYREFNMKVLVKLDPEVVDPNDLKGINHRTMTLREYFDGLPEELEVITASSVWSAVSTRDLKGEYKIDPGPECENCRKYFKASDLDHGLCAECQLVMRECLYCRINRPLKHFAIPGDTTYHKHECRFCRAVGKPYGARYVNTLYECKECGIAQWSEQGLKLHRRDEHGRKLHWDAREKIWEVA
jgi:hypothetical protein